MLTGYDDIQLIGEGGLGRVYRARKVSTGGLVAIKELRDVQEASPAWHRARRELDALLRLKGHPYVINVEEVAQGPNGPCLVMEYAPNGSLIDRVAAQPFSAAELVLIGQQVCEALSSAHELGIVHRDIKPHNLLIGSFGQVKVCDFGISQLAREGEAHTKTGALTMAYASPEEIDGEAEIGPSADVYSFGATMLHLITGKRPTFKNRMDTSTIDVSGTDPALAPVVGLLRQALSRDQEDRPSMADLAAGFDQAAMNLNTGRVRSLAIVALPTAAVAGAAAAAAGAPNPSAAALTVVRGSSTPQFTESHPPVAEPVVAAAAPDAPAAAAAATPPPPSAPPPSATPPSASATPPQEPASGKRKRLLVAAALLVVLGGGGAAFATLGGDDSDSAGADAAVVTDGTAGESGQAVKGNPTTTVRTTTTTATTVPGAAPPASAATTTTVKRSTGTTVKKTTGTTVAAVTTTAAPVTTVARKATISLDCDLSNCNVVVTLAGFSGPQTAVCYGDGFGTLDSFGVGENGGVGCSFPSDFQGYVWVTVGDEESNHVRSPYG